VYIYDLFHQKLMDMKTLYTFSLLLACSLAFSQSHYTEPTYPVRVFAGMEYGEAVDFAGNTVTLSLDMYYPVGDSNCLRPLLVMIHGGAFLSGTRYDPEILAICNEMASRGYNVASIDYRLGMLPAASYTPYALCPYTGANACIYAADKLEWERAAYRAMQDARGAIRFLKNRAALDSTDVSNVFVGGVSAGAITALYVGLLDEEAEKPAAAFQLPDGPVPDPDLMVCVPQPFSTERPDLGPVEGTLNLGQQDASVAGVAAFMGAVIDTTLLSGGTPPLYLFHRTDDLVVHCNWFPFFPLYWYCLDPTNICQPNASRPFAAGSCFISNELTSQGVTPGHLLADIVDQGFPGSWDCLDNPPGHSIANIPLRCQNLSNFLAPIIAANGNDPAENCMVDPTGETAQLEPISIFPNPLTGSVLQYRNLPTGQPYTCSLLDLTGRPLAAFLTSGAPDGSIDLPPLAPGIYYLRFSSDRETFVLKVVKG